jgi:hypothetical protein
MVSTKQEVETMKQSKRQFLKQLAGIPLLSLFGAAQAETTEAGPYTEYFLNRFSVAGFQYYNGPQLIPALKPSALLSLEAEPTNPHDRYAVQISYQGSMIGYVPRSDNKHISRLLCQGATLKCKIIAPMPESSLSAISVGVFLPSG